MTFAMSAKFPRDSGSLSHSNEGEVFTFDFRVSIFVYHELTTALCNYLVIRTVGLQFADLMARKTGSGSANANLKRAVVHISLVRNRTHLG